MNIIRNIFYLFLVSFFSFSNDMSSGLTTLFIPNEYFLNKEYDYLKDMRIGLIINHTSKVPGPLRYVHRTTYKLFKNANLNVVRIFSPEHGISGNYAAGADVPSTSEVVSLYGKNKAPQDKHLEDIDILVFDIQDIGVRYYTYISTMTLAMEKAAQNNIKFIVLDRPNPLNGISIEGPVLNPDFSSFVGMHPIPVRHGMTIGEVALFIKQNNLIKSAEKLNLKVISGLSWNRNYYSDGGRCKPSFEQTSPNIPFLQNALLYVGTCLLEGTNVSEGRGIYD